MARMSACPVAHRPKTRYQFASDPDSKPRYLRHALSHWPLVRAAILTAAFVGTALVGINQGNVLLEGGFPGTLYWKIPLTYTVP